MHKPRTFLLPVQTRGAGLRHLQLLIGVLEGKADLKKIRPALALLAKEGSYARANELPHRRNKPKCVP